MKVYFNLVSLLLFFVLLCNAENGWGQNSPTDLYQRITIQKKISLDIPQEFIVMNDDAIANRYITSRRPVALYTNPAGSADLGINKSASQWRAEDIPILKDFYKANIQSLYDKVTFLQEKTESINGQNYAVFEFISEVKDQADSFTQRPTIKKYTYIQYTIVGGVTWVFNLTAPAAQADMWGQKANHIMHTINFKK